MLTRRVAGISLPICMIQSAPDVLGMLANFFIFTTCLSMVGGALGAKLVGHANPPRGGNIASDLHDSERPRRARHAGEFLYLHYLPEHGGRRFGRQAGGPC